jgi:MFS family permease
LIDIFRFLPLAATTLTILALFLLARALLPSLWAAVAATVAFALLPRSFIWLIMGGGVTRATGLLFAVLALWRLHRFYTHRQARDVPLVILLAGATILSHLEAGLFLVISGALLFLVYGRHRRGLLGSLLIAVGAVALAAPWWGTVIAQHGIAPFLAAHDTGPSAFSDRGTALVVLITLARLGVLGTTGEPLFPVIGALALLGGLLTLANAIGALASRRRPPAMLLLPIWWIAIYVLDPRSAETYATVPVALLAGIGSSALLSLLADRPPMVRPWRALAGAGLLLGYATLAMLLILIRPARSGQGSVLVSVSKDERAAMTWVAQGTPPTSRFLVISGANWQSDRSSEWFPVLAQRVSVATPQGYEWASNVTFAQRVAVYGAVQGCADGDTTCLEPWVEQMAVDYIYVRAAAQAPGRTTTECCAVAQSLAADPRYALVYNRGGTQIFARRPGTRATSAPADRAVSTVRSMTGYR